MLAAQRVLRGRKTSSGHRFGMVSTSRHKVERLAAWQAERYGWKTLEARGTAQGLCDEQYNCRIFSGSAWSRRDGELVMGTFRHCWVHLDWNYHSTL